MYILTDIIGRFCSGLCLLHSNVSLYLLVLSFTKGSASNVVQLHCEDCYIVARDFTAGGIGASPVLPRQSSGWWNILRFTSKAPRFCTFYERFYQMIRGPALNS